MISGFNANSGVIAFLQTHHSLASYGRPELAAKNAAVSFEVFLKNEFHLFSRSHPVEFYAIFMPCTLVSHITGAFSGATYRCLPL